MSYILDALKKSDQQRQRGMTPTLHTSQTDVIALQQPAYLFYVVLAAILVCAGIVIGLLRPWQPEQSLPSVKSILEKSTVAILNQAIQCRNRNYQKFPATNTGNASANPPSSRTGFSGAKTPSAEAGYACSDDTQGNCQNAESRGAPCPEKTTPMEVTPDQREVRAMAELPASIQQEIPKISISGLVYSGDHEGVWSDQRSVDARRRISGSGLKLEQITPDGVIFSYKRYRFRR